MKNLLQSLGLVVLMSIPAAAQDYEIKFDHPRKVGQRYKMIETATESAQNTVTVAGKPPQVNKTESTVEWESIATVLEVDSSGRATKESHIVAKLNRVKGAAREPLLAGGTKVVASLENKKEVFEVDGKPASLQLAKVLGDIISLSSGGASDDDIFGTKERKKVGDSWSINEERALADAKEKLTEQGISVEKVTGKTTFQKVTKDGDSDVLHLTGSMTAKMKPPTQAGMTVSEANVQVNTTGAFPVDIVNGTKEESMVMTMSFKMSGKPDPAGPTAQAAVSIKRSGTTKTKLLK